MAWAPDYASSSELKAFLRIDDSVDDTEVGLALTAASRAIDQSAGRQFGVVDSAEDREYEALWDRRQCLYIVEIDDLSTKTGFVVTDWNGDTVAEEVTDGDGGYRLEPRNALALGKPWTRFVLPSVATTWFTVTGSWGWAAVPDPIKAATLLQSNRFLKRRDAPFGVAGSPEMGSEVRLLNRIDPDVELIIAPYRRWWAAA